jgi:O-antigen/teichoic acid export membrane protein
MTLPDLRPMLATSAATQGGLALGDQAVVSATSFVTAVVIGRVAGPDELAAYSLGLTLVLFVTAAQDSLASTPYAVYGARMGPEARAEYAGSTLAICGAIAALAATGLGAGAALAGSDSGRAALRPVFVLLAIVVPALVLREFARRTAVAHLQMRAALALDGLVAAVQVAGVLWLASRGELAATTALAAVGLGSGAGALYWLTRWPALVRVRRTSLAAAWQRSWRLGRWVFASRVAGHLNSEVLVLWLLAWWTGSSAAGTFAACLSIAFFANPLVLGTGLFLTPKMAEAFAQGGARAVHDLVARATRLLGVALLAFVGIVAAAGALALRGLYGAQYEGLGPAVTLVALAIGIGALAICAGSGLLVLERPMLNLASSVLGLAAMVAVAPLLIGRWGVTGAAVSLLAGNLVQLVARVLLFSRAAAAWHGSVTGPIARSVPHRGSL